jgi:hypothetical protein
MRGVLGHDNAQFGSAFAQFTRHMRSLVRGDAARNSQDDLLAGQAKTADRCCVQLQASLVYAVQTMRNGLLPQGFFSTRGKAKGQKVNPFNWGYLIATG